jgi:hypothetical protein
MKPATYLAGRPRWSWVLQGSRRAPHARCLRAQKSQLPVLPPIPTPGTFVLKHFQVQQGMSAMKVNTDAMLLGSWVHPHEEDRWLLDIGTGEDKLMHRAACLSTLSVPA